MEPPSGGPRADPGGCYCYLPLYVFCGKHLLAAKLRRSNIDASAGAVDEVARIVCQIRARWPRVTASRIFLVHTREKNPQRRSRPEGRRDRHVSSVLRKPLLPELLVVEHLPEFALIER
jgi:hypothetical protein